MLLPRAAGSAMTTLLIVVVIGLGSVVRAQAPTTAIGSTTPPDAMMQLLLQRVEQQPDHSDSWRVLGSYQAKQNDLQSAIRSLQHALKLDPENAAAHFDYGKLLRANSQSDQADYHFQQCAELAPASQYSAEIYERGWLPTPTLPPPDSQPNVSQPNISQASDALAIQPAGYRIQTFDGADDFERTFDRLESDADPSIQRLRFFLETGVLYNSNVSLTPISRELASADAESFQLLANPELEWIAWDSERWRSGLLLRSFLTVNESTQSAFDLASLQPGGFVERDFTAWGSDWIARFDYVYSLDYLDQQRVGDRHSMTTSLIQIRPDLDVIYAYVTASLSDFADDGVTPATSSLDGAAISGGISRFFQTEWSRLPTYSLGFDLESADTEGADFRYRAINAHAEWTHQLIDCVQFIPSVGTGYRDYYAFTGPVSRDEWTWRVQGKLRWQVNAHTAFSIVAGHDRFASDNENFDAERTQGGVLITITR